MRDGAGWMRDEALRRPGAIPDHGADGELGVDLDRPGTDGRPGMDTDGDGRPDTLLTADGPDLLVLTDLDGDGLADRVLRIDPDGSVHTTYAVSPEPPDVVDHIDHVAGHVAAAHGPWSAVLRWCGLDP
jgi:hypothetical protein